MKELIIKVDEEKMDIEGKAPLVDRPQDLVRCKDCKYFPSAPQYEPSCWKNRRRGDDPDWFCADGERKEGR